MLRWLTAGESHGPELVAIVEGMPAGIEITTSDVQDALARRRLGFGRGARMKFEQDQVQLSGGVRHGLSQGGPIAITIQNTEWPKWEQIMSPDPVDLEKLSGARAEPLTRPRPGHADFTGMQKYDFLDSRPVLERASARETAARVALGEVASRFLFQLGIELVTHTVSIGTISSTELGLPTPSDVDSLDQNPVRCFSKQVAEAMVAEIEECQKGGDTLGGVVETLVYGLPPGLGSYVHWDRKLDSQLAGALMEIGRAHV
jgi:chorismate synthase